MTVLAVVLLSSCGGEGSTPGPSPGNLAMTSPSPSPYTQDLATALAELEGMECPEGVDAELWVELKDALKEALQTELTESKPGSPARLLASPEEQDGHSMLCPYKSVATPPTGNTNRIDDLACSLSDGEYVLSWLYRNSGDYDQNGAVGISDITPLAIHFGEDTAPENEWIDGD
ncbi:hypothetical protein J7J84_05135, partial [bacterium]|nr:hypothetical protein [bacterium]